MQGVQVPAQPTGLRRHRVVGGACCLLHVQQHSAQQHSPRFERFAKPSHHKQGRRTCTQAQPAGTAPVPFDGCLLPAPCKIPGTSLSVPRNYNVVEGEGATRPDTASSINITGIRPQKLRVPSCPSPVTHNTTTRYEVVVATSTATRSRNLTQQAHLCSDFFKRGFLIFSFRLLT